MAHKEIYSLAVNVKVEGTEESKNKLSAMERYTQQTERRMKALNKILVSPTAKIKDNASNALDKIKSKASNLSRMVSSPAVKLTDGASSKIFKISSDLKKIDTSKVTPTLRLKDEASSAAEKIQKKTDKLNTSVPKVKIKAEDQASSTLNKIQSKINSWIKTGAKKIISIGVAGTIAAGGIGLGTSIKTYSEYEKGLSNVKAVTNATDSQMQQLDATAKKFGSTTQWAARSVTSAEELLGQAGFSVDETISALPGLLNLASAGDLDLATATDIASGTLKAFNLNASDSSHVADVLALSASATNSDVTDLGESMKYVAPVSQALGISLEDTAAATGLLSNANIKGSQAGTVLRQTMARLASPTSEASKLMQKYGINAFDSAGNMKPLSGVVDNLNSSLGKLTSQKRADVISTIFGTESMSGVLALMNQGGKSVSDLSEQLKNANGAAQKMSDTKLDNLNGQWIKLKAAVEHMQITLGEKLAPYAKEFVTWLTGKMPAITDKIVETVDYLSKHTEEIKSLAITVIGLGAAFTGLSAVGSLGNTLTGIASLASILKGTGVAAETTAIAGGLSKVGVLGSLLPAIFSPAGIAVAASIGLIGTAAVANSNLMKKSIATTTEELTPMQRVMNELNGHIYKSKAEMQELGLVYEDFGENISDNFKNKVEESTKAIRDFQLYISKINLDGVISDSESSEFDNKVNDMCYSAIQTIQENKSKSQESMKSMFMDDGTFSEAEQATLDYLSKDYDNNVTAEQTLRDKIYDIRKTAVEQHRALNNEDIKNIKEYQTQMAQIALESAGGNKDELLYAKNKFAARAKGLDIKDGSALAQEAAKDRDNRIVEVNATYDTNLDKLNADLEKAKSDPGATQDTIDKIKSSIEENTKSKSEKIAEINKLWDDELNSLYNSNSNLEGQINKYNGTELTGNDKTAQKGIDYLRNHFQNLNQITQEGWYRIKNTSSGEMEDVYTTIDKDTGEITGAWSKTAGWYGGYTDEMKQKVKELGEAHDTERANIQNSLIALTGSTLDSNNQVISSTGNVIGQLQGVQGATGEAITGIININGTPMQITSNASGKITEMQEYKGSIDAIPPSTDAHITSNTDEVTSSANGLLGVLESIGGHAWSAVVSITQKVFGSGGGDSTQQEDYVNPVTGVKHDINGDGFPDYATGTTNAQRGWANTAENGYEILIGKKKRWLNGGETILNHEQSKAFLQNMQNNEPVQVQQGQFQLSKPQQVQVAGVGGINIPISIQAGGNQDVDSIVQQATQEVGRKLKEALTNIKK